MKKVFKKVLFTSIFMFCIFLVRAQGIEISVTAKIAPPPLPTYVQPPCPADGYIWTPGYWAFDEATGEYYWVPGVWVAPPAPDLLWTPPYWAFVNGVYDFYPGYWGTEVGFYGGINYGFGYFGVGFSGGRWISNVFHYNTAVVNVNKTAVHHVYVDKTAVNKPLAANRASFNGEGGIRSNPTHAETQAVKQNRQQPTREQETQVNNAKADKDEFLSKNHGTPTKMSMDKVGGEHFNPKGQKIRKLSNNK
ncbi:hypothetical protein [Parafilimonas sp.]|uniref:hypothetical protein n=1 Tax=Parafilimonas sp. TaxID=1969739 RepID=UPI0039E4C326